jgi:hypothetical protein
MASFAQRIIGAARLNAATYEEVEADKTATGQALGVVLLSAVAAGIGGIADGGARGFFSLLLSALFAWVAWALVTWIVGTKLLPSAQTQSNMGELLRTIGFASSPGLLRFLCVIPLVGWVLEIAIWFWMLAAMVVAVRQALDYTSTGRAVAVCAIGWLVALGVAVVTAGLLGAGVGLLGAMMGR